MSWALICIVWLLDCFFHQVWSDSLVVKSWLVPIVGSACLGEQALLFCLASSLSVLSSFLAVFFYHWSLKAECWHHVWFHVAVLCWQHTVYLTLSFQVNGSTLFSWFLQYYETVPLHIYHFVQHHHHCLYAFLSPGLFWVSCMKLRYPIYMYIAQWFPEQRIPLLGW